MIRKAVIAVAGYGSRFFPIAKTINKCMLPVLDKPVLHLAVEDCLRAGAQEIAIVTAPGDTQVRHYFSPDLEMEEHFLARGWEAKWERVAHLHELADFTFLEQPRDGRYGTALPPMIAADFIGGDDFLCLSGDDLLLRNDGGSDLADMVTHWDSTETAAALAAAVVPGDSANRYGVLLTNQREGDLVLERLAEKPANYTEPTAHAFISRGVFPGEFMTYLDKLQPSPASGEYQITDAITSLAAERDVLVHPVTGAYLDCGDPAGLLAANLAAANAAGLAIPK